MAAKQQKIRIGMYGSGWNEYVERPFKGVLAEASKHRRVVVCDCRVSSADDDFRSDEHVPPWTGKLDGVVIAIGLGDATNPQQVAEWLARGGVPVVNISADVLDPRIPTVCTDPNSIARLASEHLLACGCRRFLHAGFSRSIGSQRRAEAFRKALRVRGFELEEYDFVAKLEENDAKGAFGNSSPPNPAALSQDARALAPVLMASPASCPDRTTPLGVLALGDPFARAVRRICDDLGLQVPGQVAIVGMNDLPMAFAQKPTLTSIRYPGEEVGRRAMQLLLSLIDGGRRPLKPIGVRATQLIVRESTVGTSKEPDDMAHALEVIRRRACTGLSVRELWKMLGVSPRWLELEFRKNLGRSPLQEINRLRMANARKLLEATELPIGQIATMTGFAWPAGLTNFFRKHSSLSASEYRQWVRQGGKKQGIRD
jgi:LacI family transcriptional regulator